MQTNITKVVAEYFEECSRDKRAPMWFIKSGPLFKLKEGYRAFINNEPVVWIGYNNANQSYHLYSETLGGIMDKSLTMDDMVEFRLDRLVFESVVA